MTGGYRHHVTAIRFSGVDALRRVVVAQTDGMDPRLWPESAVLQTCRKANLPGPCLLHDDPAAGVQILEKLPGEPLDAQYPRGSSLPSNAIDEIARVLGKLRGVRRDQVPPLPLHWPADGDASAFLCMRLSHTEELIRTFGPAHSARFGKFGVSVNQVARIRNLLPLSACDFVLCHGDLNRSNILWDGRTLSLADWELATFGDPAFELAVHLHRAGYTQDDERQLCGLLRKLHPEAVRSDALRAHREHERLRSRLVDAVRYRERAVAANGNVTLKRRLSERYVAKLREGGGPWAEMSTTEVMEALFFDRRPSADAQVS